MLPVEECVSQLMSQSRYAHTLCGSQSFDLFTVGRIRCKRGGCFSPDDMNCKSEDWTAAENEQQRSRFCSVWQVIEEVELVDEYEAWKEANPNA